MSVHVLYAWAIDARSSEGHGLLGHGWFGWDVPPHASGVRVALFPTRADARKHIARVRQTWRTARVTRVSVSIENQR